ncbi:MAG TPA: superoxide dismutase family protein [Cyanobacteria bacterium UBA12227]|nr:superoxide dismutase family protein [Cyanobacteria bacterium UBA12227]HAX89644.1 superoxide dismutase family protein [Cyanobacteria bacterium UBA11370]HBY77476.1 superoxide dismutase family protein [Cyanobacteria bacterium UBA11148]
MNPIHKTLKIVAIATLLAFLTLVYGIQPKAAFAANTSEVAEAIILSTSDPSQVLGKVSFSQTSDGMQIATEIQNAPPGKHGFHIHEFGSCEDAGNAAGGHFNPDGVKHGNLISEGFRNAHAGDLGNLTIFSDGTAQKNVTISRLTLKGEKYAIAGRAIIIHAQEDNFSQPTGNAGGRIGCGAIAKL